MSLYRFLSSLQIFSYPQDSLTAGGQPLANTKYSGMGQRETTSSLYQCCPGTLRVRWV